MGHGNGDVVAILAVHLFDPLSGRLVNNVLGGRNQLFASFVQSLRELCVQGVSRRVHDRVFG
jgi:hypothetical protein